MNIIYAVAQVDGPNSLDILGIRGFYTNVEDAKCDLYDANKEKKESHKWPHWKIFMYDVKLKGVVE